MTETVIACNQLQLLPEYKHLTNMIRTFNKGRLMVEPGTEKVIYSIIEE